MEEIEERLKKYNKEYIRRHLADAALIDAFALSFYKDVSEIYDAITRVHNVERNPNGFDLNDAPILGLLVRVWKLLKEILKYYEQNNAEIISVLDRPLFEASIVATYLMSSDNAVVEDYRKCSYKGRLRLLNDLVSGSRFLETKPGKRLLLSIQAKMLNDGLAIDDFGQQKVNRWKLQGKSFYDIFAEVEHADLYACTYGIMSESIHGSWNESMDYCLSRNDGGTYSAFPFFQPVDIRYLAPMLRFTNRPFGLWLQRIDAADEDLMRTLEWIDLVNMTLFKRFDEVYDG